MGELTDAKAKLCDPERYRCGFEWNFAILSRRCKWELGRDVHVGCARYLLLKLWPRTVRVQDPVASFGCSHKNGMHRISQQRSKTASDIAIMMINADHRHHVVFPSGFAALHSLHSLP